MERNGLMLTHMLYARAARGYDKPDFEAHASFSCKVGNFGSQIMSGCRHAYSRMTGIFGF